MRQTARPAIWGRRVGVGVPPLPREGVSVERGQEGIPFREDAPDARLVTVDLDVPDVADLLERGEGLAGNPIP